jgi:predicted AlkP superfamily pyrophosphatase or phosphodiesterase
MKRLFILLWLALPVCAQSNHVIIISLDGGQPEFYLPGELSKDCERLTGRRDRGSYARGALPPYPSMTYPGQTTIATGVLPVPLKGNHGFLPTHPQLHTSFIACGFGIKKGVVLETIRLADVAPTVARLFGVKLDSAEGRVLEEILASGG